MNYGVVIGLTGLLALLASAPAEVLYQTGFEPPDFRAATLAGQETWKAQEKAAMEVQSGGIGYQNAGVDVPGGCQNASIYLEALAQNAGTFVHFAEQDGPIYFRLTMSWEWVATRPGRVMLVILGERAPSTNASLGIAVNNSHGLILARVTDQNGGGQAASSGPSFAKGEAVLIVGKIYKEGSKTYNRIVCSLNPSTTGEPKDWQTMLEADSGAATLSTLQVRSLMGAGQSEDGRFGFDNVMIATSYGDLLGK